MLNFHLTWKVKARKVVMTIMLFMKARENVTIIKLSSRLNERPGRFLFANTKDKRTSNARENNFVPNCRQPAEGTTEVDLLRRKWISSLIFRRLTDKKSTCGKSAACLRLFYWTPLKSDKLQLRKTLDKKFHSVMSEGSYNSSKYWESTRRSTVYGKSAVETVLCNSFNTTSKTLYKKFLSVMIEGSFNSSKYCECRRLFRRLLFHATN